MSPHIVRTSSHRFGDLLVRGPRGAYVWNHVFQMVYYIPPKKQKPTQQYYLREGINTASMAYFVSLEHAVGKKKGWYYGN